MATLLALPPGGPAIAQPYLPGGQGSAQPLLPPSLPGTLPGGMPLPVMPGTAQADILQRIIDAAGNRSPGSPPPAPAPTPAYSPGPGPIPVAPIVPRPDPGEPLSNTEAFFAARLPEQQPPLRQFGYDTFRNLAPAANGLPPVVGAMPDSYVLGRDDEVVISIRGRARQSLSLRVGRDGMIALPDLPPFPAAGRSLRDLRADIEMRVARELGGSEAFVSLGQTRQIGIFVAGEVVRPGLVPLPALSSLLDALGAAGGIRRTGSLRAIRVEGPEGARIVDLYAAIAGAPGTPNLSLREGERVVVPPLGGVVALGGDVTRPGIYELPANSAGASVAAMLALAGGTLRPAGNRLLSTGTDAGGRRAMAELSPRSIVRRGDALIISPGVDAVSGGLRLAGHVVAPVTRGVGPRGAGLRALLSDPRVIRPDPYVRMGVAWRMDERTRVRRFIAFDLGRVMNGQAELPLQEGDEVILLSQADVLWLAAPPVQRALRGEVAAAPAIPMPGATAAAGAIPGVTAGTNPGTPPGMTPGAAPMVPAPDCPALTALAVAARSSPLRFAHARSAGFPDLGAGGCPQVFIDYPALLPFLLDQAVLLAGEVRLPGLYPVLEDTGLDMVLAAAGGTADTADLSGLL